MQDQNESKEIYVREGCNIGSLILMLIKLIKLGYHMGSLTLRVIGRMLIKAMLHSGKLKMKAKKSMLEKDAI